MPSASSADKCQQSDLKHLLEAVFSTVVTVTPISIPVFPSFTMQRVSLAAPSITITLVVFMKRLTAVGKVKGMH